MTKKDIFIKLVENEIFSNDFRERLTGTFTEEELDEAESYWEDFKKGASSNTKEITEKGIAIVTFMQESNFVELSAKEIGEGMSLSGRSIAASMKKLCADGYVEKIEGTSPAIYTLTEKGKAYTNN